MRAGAGRLPPPPPHALGACDCEAWRPGPLGQPTNAVTALAYVAAGTWLAARARRVPPRHRWRGHLAAAGAVTTGIGSFAYHGLGGRLAHVLHDGSLVALLAWTPIGAWRPVPAAVGSDVRSRRRVALGALAVGLVGYRLGRTGAATCRPTSRWQWHGLWHVAGALATAVWSDATDVLPYTDGGPGGRRAEG